MLHPYLPDIMEGIVTRMDEAFSARATDPFNVSFGKGNYSQVANDIYRSAKTANMIWLSMPYEEQMGKSAFYYSETVFSLMIATATEGKFTQQQRDDITIKPRLLPMYDLLLQELQREGWLKFTSSDIPEHKKVIRPYWGGGDAGGTYTDNLFKQKVDAISVIGIKAKVNEKSCQSAYQPLEIAQYPVSAATLVFYDDMELIVGGNGEYDPETGETSVDIPVLAGRDYEVEQQFYGRLRSARNPQIIKKAEGGFTLQDGQRFDLDDTYIIKLKPTFKTPDSETGVTTKKIDTVSIQNN